MFRSSRKERRRAAQRSSHGGTSCQSSLMYEPHISQPRSYCSNKYFDPQHTRVDRSPWKRGSAAYVPPTTHHVPRSPSTSSQRFKRSGNRCTYPRLSASPSLLSFTLKPNLDASEPCQIAPQSVMPNRKVREPKSGGKGGRWGRKWGSFRWSKPFSAAETCWGERLVCRQEERRETLRVGLGSRFGHNAAAANDNVYCNDSVRSQRRMSTNEIFTPTTLESYGTNLRSLHVLSPCRNNDNCITPSLRTNQHLRPSNAHTEIRIAERRIAGVQNKIAEVYSKHFSRQETTTKGGSRGSITYNIWHSQQLRTPATSQSTSNLQAKRPLL